MAQYNIRWAQLDVARQMESIEFIEKFIVLLSECGYNGILLYLEDRIKTASYQLPEANEVYTVDEIKHIVSFAGEYGMEVVPCVATLGHAERFLRHKELEYMAELQGDMIGRFGGKNKLTFCITNPDFYDFIGTYLKEVAELFPSQWFHVGLDEFWDFNMCERCKKAMPTLMDEQKMFIKHINKIRDIMSQCGKRIMMWSDMFEFYPDVFQEVPRDVVMVDWQYLRDIRNYQGHLLDVDNENRLAVNAANGFETIAAPADRLWSNSRSYFEYANGKPGVIGGLLTSWEKSDTFLYRTLPNFVAGGFQMNGMSIDAAFDAMCQKLFGTDDLIFKSALKIALDNGLLRHFDGVKENAICNRDYFGLDHAAITVCKSVRAILQTYATKITTEWGKICLDDLLDALWEKSLSCDAQIIAHDIFDNSCTAERQQRFADFRQGFADYFDHMARRWEVYRPGITPNVFAMRKDAVCKQLENLENRLASNAWVRVNGTLPDGFGVEFIDVEYKVNGQWQQAGVGVFKPTSANVGMFCRFLPLPQDFSGAVEAVRLTTHGLGGVGLNFVEVCANGKHYVPRTILRTTGKVSDPCNLLADNTTFAWFGGQSTRYDYFDRHAAEQRNSVVIEMKEFDASRIAMAGNCC
ncbi:MAG: hypothetical protein E7047_07495 [Lentisphaerae bacterium]|nr:hypothetical protein [Lentisphaerota bacterium]